jgi:phage terminase large subunit-like protein
MGALEVTPGNAVDQDYVKQAIEEDLEMFEVEQIGFDPWNARKLVGDLTKAGAGADRGEDDALFVEIRQGILSLGEGSKEFERRVFDGTLDHGGHPVLRWMAGHCVIRFDENLNFMPAKKRSRDKIDGIVAGVMTEALALAAPPPFRSAYEDHGLVEIDV